MRFCGYCGKQLNDGEECSCPGAIEERASKKGIFRSIPMDKMKRLLIPAAIALIVLIVIISALSYSNSEIDLTDYIVIEDVTGLNGQGVLKYKLDESALMMALWGDSNDVEITEENFEAIMAENIAKHQEIANAMSCITISANKASNLSNGDTVTVTAAFENKKGYKFNYHFKNGRQTYTVSGLADGKTYDPFDEKNLSVTFSGIDSKGEATLEILCNDAPASLFQITLSQTQNLCNGDVLTLTAKVNETALTKLGYLMPETMERTVTVTGLAEGEAIDPFAEDYISVVFSGISGRGEATVEVLTEEGPLSLFRYKLSQDEDLCNGDTVTLTAKVREQDLLDRGYLMPETLEKTYVVEGLGTYFDFADGFPADELKKLCDKALAGAAAEEQDDIDSGHKIIMPSVVHGAYIMKAKDPNKPYEDLWEGRVLDNTVVVVTSYKMEYSSFHVEREWWYIWVFPNYYLDPEGNLSYDIEQEYAESQQDETLESFEEWIRLTYSVMDVTELPLPE